MTSAEIIDAMRLHMPVIVAHPTCGVLQYRRIVGLSYGLTERQRRPTNDRDGITVSVIVEDYSGNSLSSVDPAWVHGYTKEAYEKMIKEWNKAYEKAKA